MDIACIWKTSVILQLFGGLSNKSLEASRQSPYIYFTRPVMITDSSMEERKQRLAMLLHGHTGHFF
jgi:hypothetical protein